MVGWDELTEKILFWSMGNGEMLSEIVVHPQELQNIGNKGPVAIWEAETKVSQGNLAGPCLQIKKVKIKAK